MFDVEKVKAESGLSRELLARIEQKVRDDFDDDMMFELHFIRAIHAIKEGQLTPERVLAEEAPV